MCRCRSSNFLTASSVMPLRVALRSASICCSVKLSTSRCSRRTIWTLLEIVFVTLEIKTDVRVTSLLWMLLVKRPSEFKSEEEGIFVGCPTVSTVLLSAIVQLICYGTCEYPRRLLSLTTVPSFDTSFGYSSNRAQIGKFAAR